MNLEIQNKWVTIDDLCIPLALRWLTLLHDCSPALLKFYLNAFQITLPDQSNLVRWGKATEKSCNICGEAVGTSKHLLVGCEVLLEKGQYSRRDDKVSEVIHEAVSLSIARAQKGITTTKRSIEFVLTNSMDLEKARLKNQNKAASDWTIRMDTYEKQYRIHKDIVVYWLQFVCD